MSSTNLSVEIFASGLSESNMRVHKTFGYLCHGEPTRTIFDRLRDILIAQAIWLSHPFRIASIPICSAILPVEPELPTVLICRIVIFNLKDISVENVIIDV